MAIKDSPVGQRVKENTSNIPDDPTARLGFEVKPASTHSSDESEEANPSQLWQFAPAYYPDRFVQVKPRELDRDGKQCEGEDVSLKTLKNREFHASGIILAFEIPIFHQLMDFSNTVDVISPLTPMSSGMECEIKDAELGEKEGWDPIYKQWQFNYTIDLVSTGHDEYDNDENAIVSAILDS
jgi:hypothetical protein